LYVIYALHVFGILRVQLPSWDTCVRVLGFPVGMHVLRVLGFAVGIHVLCVRILGFPVGIHVLEFEGSQLVFMCMSFRVPWKYFSFIFGGNQSTKRN